MKKQKSKFETVEKILPAYWASYLINGDASGIDDADKLAADEYLKAKNLPAPADVGEGYFLAECCDAPGQLGGEMAQYTFLVPIASPIHCYASPLAAKCAARNEANAQAMKLAGELLAILSPFVGKQIITGTGNLFAKVKELLPVSHWREDIHYWRNSTSWGLGFTVKVDKATADKNGRQFAHYAEASFTVGRLNGQILEGLEPAPVLRIDYTPAKVRKLRDQFTKTKDAFRKAKAALHPFGEYDQ